MTNKLPIKILRPNAHMPTWADAGSAGLDLYYSSLTPSKQPDEYAIWVSPGERKLIPTGIAVAIPSGYVGLICPRSGLALTYGVSVLNAPGVIDESFRGELQVILVNHDKVKPLIVEDGHRIGQLLVVPIVCLNLEVVDDLPKTDRGEKGFGSSGR